MAAKMVYRSRPIKRRRTKAEVEALETSIYELVEAERPMSVRQVFYRLVASGLIDKTEAEYKNTVVRLLGKMRKDRRLPFAWISDNTRWQRKGESHTSLEEMLRITKWTYRRALWTDQQVHVECWLEKEALAGVIFEATDDFDVPLMVTRGYPSLSFLSSAAEEIADVEKPTHLYYFGDHDPSGRDIARHVEETLRDLAPYADISFEFVAVTPQQIIEWELPTRPTKRTDSRARGFEGDSVELDAIPPERLRALVRGCVEQNIDPETLRRTKAVEAAEQERLEQVIESLRGVA